MAIVHGKQPNLAAAREIKLVLYTNPTATALTGYRTMIPGAAVAEKLNGGMDDGLVRIIDVGTGLVIPHWAESYGADPADVKVWHKISPDANKVEPIIIYDVPPSPAPPDGGGGDEDDDDPEHKKNVTDITPTKGHTIYLLFAGGATPAGYDLVSGAGGYFADRFPVGNKVGIVTTSDTSKPEYASMVCSNDIQSTAVTAFRTGSWAAEHTTRGHIHTLSSPNLICDASDAKPVYSSLKMLRVHKIKSMIPQGAIIIFDDTVPTGFTRYAAQDNKYIRCEAGVGAGGGNATRTFRVHGVTDTNAPSNTGNGATVASYILGSHAHTFDQNTAAINNLPPTQNVILGQADNDLAYIPAGAILMFDETPPADDWEVVAALEGKLLKGNAGYSDGGGTSTLTPAQLVGNTSTTSQSWVTKDCETSAFYRYHYHILTLDFDPVTTYPACRQMVFAKARHQIDDDGYEANIIASDVEMNASPSVAAYSLYSTCGKHVTLNNNGILTGVLHVAYIMKSGGEDHIYHGYSIDGGETWDSERVDASWNGPQLYAGLVIDNVENVHFIWAEGDAGDANRRQIKYRRLSSLGAWGAVETVSTAGNPWYQYTPCIQVKTDGETIGVAWAGYGWGADAWGIDVAYRERTPIGWQAEEQITANAAWPNYYRLAALEYDSTNYPHIAYNYNNDELYYRYKTGMGWQAQEHINNDDAGKCDQHSNIVIDSDNTVHIVYQIEIAAVTMQYDQCYKQRPSGGAWSAKETIIDDYGRVPQIQINSDGEVYCGYTWNHPGGAFGFPLSDYTMDLRYKLRASGGGWGAEVTLITSTARGYMYGLMLWGRMPYEHNIMQSFSHQNTVWICLASEFGYFNVGNLEMIPDPNAVVGDIDDDITTETYRFRQRGAICRQKINHGKITPYAIG